MTRSPLFLLACSAILVAHLNAHAQPYSPLDGDWELIPASSTDIDHFRSLSLAIRTSGTAVTVIHTYHARVSIVDSITVAPGGPAIEAPVEYWVNPINVHMGMRRTEGSVRVLSGEYGDERKLLSLEEVLHHRGSQGEKPVSIHHQYALTDGDDVLTYTVTRSTRQSGPAITYMFKRKGSRHAYVIRLAEDFTIPGGLPLNAMMISLQGIANKTGPLVYLLYPDGWPFTYVGSVLDFYKDKTPLYIFRTHRHPQLRSQRSVRYAKGYVVWDTAVRTSLIVAYTVAGLEDAVVVTEAELPLVQKAGLRPIEDFRGRFAGMSDIQIYTWAYGRYWNRCSKEFIVWLGGEHGPTMKPAVADWGIMKRVFFNDLSTRVTDTDEYALADRLLSEMKPMSMVMGWHSYSKDLEEEHVTLTSRYGHRVEGLNTLPNLSFSAQIPTSPGFVFRNNHHVQPGERIQPKEKVYISCVQTDGMGLGAWHKPGRGEIPYAWECLMNYTWMAPGMAEYFYSTATPNDYLIGCLSGPGYLYPKAVPPVLLEKLIAMAREQMKTLDLRVFEIMDWSQGSEVEGNTDLTQRVIDMYYNGMPEAIGFVNGYGPGYTFTARDSRPLISYDYYLSPHRPEADAVADLQELATLNPRRPYFLLVHVREYSDVQRVKSILDRLGPEFEVVPLDVLLNMAGAQPTFEAREYCLTEGFKEETKLILERAGIRHAIFDNVVVPPTLFPAWLRGLAWRLARFPYVELSA